MEYFKIGELVSILALHTLTLLLTLYPSWTFRASVMFFLLPNIKAVLKLMVQQICS